MNFGHYFDETGTEEDMRKALRAASDCLSGVGGVTYEGVGALLYSKPVYYIYFIVDGIDAEFIIVVPNILDSDSHYEMDPNLRITCRPFGCSMITTIATGETPDELAKSFASALSDEELRTSIAELSSADERRKYISNEWRNRRQEIIAPIAKNLN